LQSFCKTIDQILWPNNSSSLPVVLQIKSNQGRKTQSRPKIMASIFFIVGLLEIEKEKKEK